MKKVLQFILSLACLVGIVFVVYKMYTYQKSLENNMAKKCLAKVNGRYSDLPEHTKIDICKCVEGVFKNGEDVVMMLYEIETDGFTKSAPKISTGLTHEEVRDCVAQSIMDSGISIKEFRQNDY